jgi:predicted acylesterase/phospholipase RssA
MGGAAGSLPAEKRRVVLVREGTPPPGTVQVVEERLGVPVAAQLALDPGPPPRLREDDLARLARRLSHAAVGLALGGGGARGLAHIGILEVLRREKVPVDVVGGTSIGSIIAALHVVGHAPDAIREIVRREWVERNPLNDFTLPKVAFVRGRRGEKVLRRVFGDVRIEDLPTPYFAVAADLVAAEEVVLSRGPLWLAVRASGSIPVLLTPVKADGRFLVDGGVINNVPGDHLARFGADVSIAVDVSPRREAYFESHLARPGRVGLLGRIARRSGLLREWLDYPGIIRTLRRVIAIEGLEIMKTKSAAFDVCIQPDVEGFDLLDFGKIDRLVEAGREAALKALPAIRVGVGAAAARRGPGGRTAS